VVRYEALRSIARSDAEARLPTLFNAVRPNLIAASVRLTGIDERAIGAWIASWKPAARLHAAGGWDWAHIARAYRTKTRRFEVAV
jgi:hypothetical protein